MSGSSSRLDNIDFFLAALNKITVVGKELTDKEFRERKVTVTGEELTRSVGSRWDIDLSHRGKLMVETGYSELATYEIVFLAASTKEREEKLLKIARFFGPYRQDGLVIETGSGGHGNSCWVKIGILPETNLDRTIDALKRGQKGIRKILQGVENLGKDYYENRLTIEAARSRPINNVFALSAGDRPRSASDGLFLAPGPAKQGRINFLNFYIAKIQGLNIHTKVYQTQTPEAHQVFIQGLNELEGFAIKLDTSFEGCPFFPRTDFKTVNSDMNRYKAQLLAAERTEDLPKVERNLSLISCTMNELEGLLRDLMRYLLVEPYASSCPAASAGGGTAGAGAGAGAGAPAEPRTAEIGIVTPFADFAGIGAPSGGGSAGPGGRPDPHNGFVMVPLHIDKPTSTDDKPSSHV